MSRVQWGWWGLHSQPPNPEVQAAHSLSFLYLCLQFEASDSQAQP